MTFPNLTYFKQLPEIKAALAPYSLQFADAILPILYLEGGLNADGGLNNTPSDRGGLTKFGISQRAYPHLDIANLTLAQAVRLFHRDYWRPMQCGELNAGVALMLLDGAVQHGVPSMTMLVQRYVGAKPDGRFGPLTLKACHGVLPIQLCVGLSLKRARKYARICANDTTQTPNLNGWYNRLEHITERAIAGVHHG
ncbi:glycoside hydrolase family 108 protein [Pseudoalteromonas sp. S16_S37]|uniref:glycoside hydrolase family 108 protein n=1 Tax=Pseudoalteromonas sp. S16_S37 TaxID=2720228 RepID=UPI001680FB45|nr:glycosyl hydrolase 108 family protein [Pseudoalteromonas sp. S16_S37]MBD1584916.1 secretion activator protein [Pseudoalteromonas sp. S16_S37]